MSWQDQGRQYHMWFGSGHAPVKLRPVVDKDGSTMEDGLDERLRTVVHGAIGALPRKLRGQAEQQLQAATLARLTEAMAAWIYGSKMDGVSFAHHFFDRDADDPVVGSLRAAASETVDAETRPQLAKASEDLADAMKAIGLDRWPRFVADAQKRAHEKATLAAIQTSRQPPDLHKDAIKPVYPVETALAAGAAALTGGVSAVVRTVGGMIASKIVGDNRAPSGNAQDSTGVGAKGGESPTAAPAAEAPVVKPAAADKPPPSASKAETPPGAAEVWAPPKGVTEKIPTGWGPGRPNQRGIGLRWSDPENPKANIVRVDKGNPQSPYLTQRTDHVVVQSGGKVLGRDGKPILGSIKENFDTSHIPLNEYQTWSKWNTP